MSAAADRRQLIEAVELALAGDRSAARAAVGQTGDDPTACWIRAALHKIEGDETGARAWYRRSGQFYESYADPQAELAAIKAALTY